MPDDEITPTGGFFMADLLQIHQPSVRTPMKKSNPPTMLPSSMKVESLELSVASSPPPSSIIAIVV